MLHLQQRLYVCIPSRWSEVTLENLREDLLADSRMLFVTHTIQTLAEVTENHVDSVGSTATEQSEKNWHFIAQSTLTSFGKTLPMPNACFLANNGSTKPGDVPGRRRGWNDR